MTYLHLNRKAHMACDNNMKHWLVISGMVGNRFWSQTIENSLLLTHWVLWR